MNLRASNSFLTATTGFFDGVHKGHMHILRSVQRDAEEHNCLSAVVTFRRHPRQVLQQDYIPKLLTLPEERRRRLVASGIGRVIMLDFTVAFSRLTAREYMAFLRDEYNVRRLLAGYDHRFGHNREEGFSDYKRIGAELGIDVFRADAFKENDTFVSSSVIRRLLRDGNVSLANEYLGRRFCFRGVVVRGRGEGRKLGFPTANLLTDAMQLLPKRGVYGVEAAVEGCEERFTGMMNIGCRPTYGGGEETVEVNIFGFDADIYGRELRVEVFSRLRDERTFGSVGELVSQLHCDKAMILTSLQR